MWIEKMFECLVDVPVDAALWVLTQKNISTHRKESHMIATDRQLNRSFLVMGWVDQDGCETLLAEIGPTSPVFRSVDTDIKPIVCS